MKVLHKTPGEDFIILNVSDPQLSNEDWQENHPHQKILSDTLTALIQRTKPDLITVSGDLAWGGNAVSCTNLAKLINSFRIPWAPVWGMNDNLGGASYIESMADQFSFFDYCLYEKGPQELGNGNYVIAIEENGKVVEGIILMDSHGSAYYKNEKGENLTVCTKIWPNQIRWYQDQIKILQEMGCCDTAIIRQIPFFAYHEAFEKAFNRQYDPHDVTLEESYRSDCWNDGYQNSFGVCHEAIASYHNSYGNCAEPMKKHPDDDGMLAIIKESNSTKTIIAGQDHTNNFVIQHDGVTFVYSLKLGAGSYWDPLLNGGTVLRVSENGVKEIHHEYVKIKFYYTVE